MSKEGLRSLTAKALRREEDGILCSKFFVLRLPVLLSTQLHPSTFYILLSTKVHNRKGAKGVREVLS